MHAELCPVCNGTGKYEKNECHGCNGKGWIIVVGTKDNYIPIPQPYPAYPIPYYPEPYTPQPWQPYLSTWLDTTTTATPLLDNIIITYS